MVRLGVGYKRSVYFLSTYSQISGAVSGNRTRIIILESHYTMTAWSATGDLNLAPTGLLLYPAELAAVCVAVPGASR